MPKSLKVMIKKLAHDGKITEEDYNDLIKKLDGHDKFIRSRAYAQGKRDGYYEGQSDGIEYCVKSDPHCYDDIWV